MTITEAPAETRPFVEAIIRYTARGSEGATLYSQDHDRSTFNLEEYKMRVRNARAKGPRLSFDKNGFTVIDHHSKVDFLDKSQVEKDYYPQAEEIIRALTGASDVIVFLDLIRSEKRDGTGAEVAHNAHVDFDEESVRRWVSVLRPAEAARLLKKRILNINLWRPIKPVERMPLAICDATSVSRNDLVRTVIGGKPGEPAGPFAGYNLCYNPEHRWYYYPQMQPGEVLAFKLFDSELQRPHLTAHTAFEDPTSPPGAAPRLSHEIRTIAFLDS